MKKGAVAILIAMIAPILVWAGSSIMANTTQIARLDERHRSNKELLIEMRKDIRIIKNALIRGVNTAPRPEL